MEDGPLAESLSRRQLSPRNKVLMHYLRWTVAIVVMAMLAWTIWKAALDLATQPVSWREVRWHLLTLALVFSGLALGCVAALWHGCLQSMGVKVPARQAAKAFFASQLAKYVPGKAMVLIVRCAILCGDPSSRDQARIGPVIASSFVETLVWVLVGAEIGCIGLIFLNGVPEFLQWGAWGVLALFGLVTLPPIFSKLLDTLGRWKRPGDWSAPSFRLTWKNYLGTCLWSLIGWSLNGLSLLCVMISLTHEGFSINLYGVALTTICLSTVGGFISMFPGGLGVRELVMLPMLTLSFSPGIALVIAIFMRLVGITAETILAMGSAALNRRSGNRQASQT